MPKRPLSPARSQLLPERAHQMRHAMTASEARLWSALSASRLGVGFRRQVVTGECIVDFAAPKAPLVATTQGDSERMHVAIGGRWLPGAARPAQDVMHDLPAAVARIRAAL